MKGCAIQNELHSLLRLNLSTFDAYHQVVLLVPRHGTETATRWYTAYLNMVRSVPRHGTETATRWYTAYLNMVRSVPRHEISWYMQLFDYKHAVAYRNISLIRSNCPSVFSGTICKR